MNFEYANVHETADGRVIYVNEDGEPVFEERKVYLDSGSTFENNGNDEVIVQTRVKPNSKISNGKKPKKLDKSGRDFSMLFMVELQKIVPTLTINERAVVMTLLPHVDYNGVCIVRDEYGQETRMTVSKLFDLMGSGWDTPKPLKQTLNSLEEKGIIVRTKDGRTKNVDVNPLFVYRGDRYKREKAIETFQQKRSGG